MRISIFKRILFLRQHKLRTFFKTLKNINGGNTTAQENRWNLFRVPITNALSMTKILQKPKKLELIKSSVKGIPLITFLKLIPMLLLSNIIFQDFIPNMAEWI